MKFGFILLSVLSLLMFFIFLILGNKSLIQSPEVKAIIDIVTVFIGVMSFVSGMVSIKVMLSQEKIQEELLEAQKREHQPNFMIDYKISNIEEGGKYDIEDFTIENIGEPMISPAKISLRTFIKVEYNNIQDNISKVVYFPLTYYYNATSSTENMKGLLLRSIGNESLQNHGKFVDLYFEANNYTKEHEYIYIYLSKVDMYKISYIDIYEDNRVNYYMGSYRVSKEMYDMIMGYAENINSKSKSIVDVTLSDLIDVALAEEK